jgi:hypothetical protein
MEETKETEEARYTAKQINYLAIHDMSKTEGWRILHEMLEYDAKFASGLALKPIPEKQEDKNSKPKLKYITDIHDIGRARGIYSTAYKYLNLVQVANRRNEGV